MHRKAIVSVLVLVTMFLGACVVPSPAPVQQPAEPAAKEAATEAPAAETPAAEAKPTGKITLWLHPMWVDGAAEVEWFDRTARQFEQENPGTEVEVVWVPWDGAYQKKAVAIQTGQVPDISHAGSEQAITFAALGGLLPVDDIIEEMGGPSAFLDGAAFRYWNGHYWGIPSAETGYNLFVRKDLAAQQGISECPATWDDLMAAAEKVNDPSNDVYGMGLDFSAGNGTRQLYETFMSTSNATELDENGKVAVNTPEHVKLLKFYTDFALKGLTPQAAQGIQQYTITNTPLDDWFKAGKTVFTIRGNMMAPVWEKTDPELWANTMLCPIPAGDAGHTGTFAQPITMYLFKDAPNPELAKEYLRFYLRPDIQKSWAEESTYPILVDVEYSFADAEWYKILQEELRYGTRAGGRTVHPKNGDAEESFWPSLMIQDVIINNMSVEDALAKWQTEVEKIYGEPCSPLVTGCE
jgi:multiple sugar transport system substrate-binding protein